MVVSQGKVERGSGHYKESIREDPGCSPGKHETWDWRNSPDLLFPHAKGPERQTDSKSWVGEAAGQVRDEDSKWKVKG